MKTLMTLLILCLQFHTAFANCPLTELKESAEDCPWAEITRQFLSQHSINDQEFKKSAPEIFRSLTKDAQQDFMKLAWGKSINFDEGVKNIIVDPKILDFIFNKAQVFNRNDRIVHAGFEHTYGYLFSNLQTPYGYKRARWVKDDIEKGFGFKKGILGPKPSQGTLFSNITAFGSYLAFRDEPKIIHSLKKQTGFAQSIALYPYQSLKIQRLSETLTLSNDRTVELRTDIVEFPKTKGANSALLVYSIKDSIEDRAKLITLFPVAQSFSEGVFKPENLGNDKEIKTRYNAYVLGVTDSPTPLKGLRVKK